MTPKLAVVGDSGRHQSVWAIHAATHERSWTFSIPDYLGSILPRKPYVSAAQPNMTGGSCKGSQETHNKLTGQSESPRLASPS